TSTASTRPASGEPTFAVRFSSKSTWPGEGSGVSGAPSCATLSSTYFHCGASGASVMPSAPATIDFAPGGSTGLLQPDKMARETSAQDGIDRCLAPAAWKVRALAPS